MKKKVLSAVLAAAMGLTLLAPTAFAADNSGIVGVYQGEDLYITVKPYKINSPDYKLPGVTSYAGFSEGYTVLLGPYDNRHGYRVGYADKNGDIVLETWTISPGMILDSSLQVHDGIVQYWDGETSTSDRLGLPSASEVLWGYMTIDGEVVREPSDGQELCEFRDGYALINDLKKKQILVIDTSGKVVQTYPAYFPDYYRYMNDTFGEGIFSYETDDDRRVFEDIHGNTLFSVNTAPDENGLYPDRLIFPAGNTRDTTAHFSGGYTVARDYRGITAEEIAYNEAEQKYAIVNRSEEVTGTIRQMRPAHGAEFCCGLLPVAPLDNRNAYPSGAVDATGKLAIPFGRVGSNFAACGVAAGDLGNPESGLVIDTKGNTVIPRNINSNAPKLSNGDILDVVLDSAYDSGTTARFSDDGLALAVSNYVSTKPMNYYLLEVHPGVYSGSAPVIYRSSTAPAAPEPKPAGSEPSSWAAEAVNQAKDAGIVPESLQTKYTAPTTRAEFCALAVALYEKNMGEITARKTFSDTKDVNVEKMAALGVVNGTGGDQFSPNGKLTREQAATMLSRLAEVMGQPMPAGTSGFSDNKKIAKWAYDAVGQVQAAGIMNGVDGNKFSSQGSYTREQSILTMNRMLEYTK